MSQVSVIPHRIWITSSLNAVDNTILEALWTSLLEVEVYLISSFLQPPLIDLPEIPNLYMLGPPTF